MSEFASSTKTLACDDLQLSYRWAQANYNRWSRLWDIGWVTIKLLFAIWLDQQHWSYESQPPTPKQKSQRNQQRAVWLREAILHLGPTFIKIGQFFSTRADILPAEYIEELSKLQDQVPAFSYEKASSIVEKELGKTLQEIYLQFDPIPLASASLGQVHHAKLHSGEEIVVKVQRPGLQRLFTIDLGILKSIAGYVQYRTPLGKGGRDWLGIYEECQRTLWAETDYLQEGRNADTFRRNFRDSPEIRVPRIYWRYSTPEVLTMEYLPGIKVSDLEALAVAGIDRSAIAQLGAKCYLQQLLHHGFFHADPHPGNLAVQPDGALVFYDFGMMGQLPLSTKNKLMLTFSGIIRQDANLVVQSMVELGALAPNSDLGPVRRSVQYMLDTYLAEELGSHESISMAEISEDLYELSYDQPFRFPATFTFVLRSLSSLEALGKSLDPQFNFLEVAQPFAVEIMAQDNSGEVNTVIEQFTRQATQFTNTSLNLPQRVNNTLDQLEQGDLRLRINSLETKQGFRQLSNVGIGLIYALLFGSLLLSATQLLIAGWTRLAGVALLAAVLVVLLLARLILVVLNR